MTTLTEADVEAAALDWRHRALGWQLVCTKTVQREGALPHLGLLS